MEKYIGDQSPEYGKLPDICNTIERVGAIGCAVLERVDVEGWKGRRVVVGRRVSQKRHVDSRKGEAHTAEDNDAATAVGRRPLRLKCPVSTKGCREVVVDEA